MVDSCACNAAPALRLACAGAADAGALADQAARPFTWEGAGIMLCLTGIGGRLPGIAKSNEAAVKILVIDGCPLDCARKSLEQAGILGFQHLQMSGSTPRKFNLRQSKPVSGGWLRRNGRS